MKRALTIGSLLFMLLIGNYAFAQVPEEDTQTVIEDAVTGTEVDEDTDWTIVTDFLEDLRRKPLNLNTASRDELSMIPGFNETLITNLQEHIRRFGKLTSIYELQAIEGMNKEAFEAIKTYTTVKELKAKDINPDELHPAGPALSEILSGLNGEVMVRWVRILEEQKGYTPPDTNSDGSLTSRYQGSPDRIYTRFRMRYGQNVSIALLGEKDSGEQFTWDPDNQFYGFDYLNGHFFLKNFGKLKRLVVGDYNIQVGQGMLLSSGLGFGKGGETINAVKRPNLGIRPYASVNENQFLRGAAATYAIKHFYFTGFGSRIGRDANITATDTLTDQVELVSSFQTSGLHRTLNELEDKDAITETLVGGRVEYRSKRLTIGTTNFYQQLDGQLAQGAKDYQFYNFSGNQNYLNGIDFDWTYRNFNFFGEAGRSKSGGTGVLAGFMTALAPNFEVATVFRNLETDFHSSRGYIFAERPTALQNERGLYMGIKYKPFKKWTLSAYMDQFVFPWHRFNVSFPSKGYEYMAQLEYKPKRSTLMYVRFRSDHKEQNASSLPEGQQLEMLIPSRKINLRGHFMHKIDRKIRVQTRLEHSWYERQNEEKHTGLLLYQDLIWQIHQKVKVTGRYAIFDVPDYDSRIYAYENDVLGFFSIPAYSGKGSRYYFILNYKAVKGLEFWLRYAQTQLRETNTIGSGLSEIQGNTQTEVKFQVRYKW